MSKESYHPFKKKLFTTLQKQLQSTFSYNCSKKKIGLLSLWKMRGLTWKLHADLLYITLFLGSQFVNGSCLCQIFSCSVLKFRQVPHFVVPLLERFLIKTVFAWSQKHPTPIKRGFIVPVLIWYVAAVEILKKKQFCFLWYHQEDERYDINCRKLKFLLLSWYVVGHLLLLQRIVQTNLDTTNKQL